MNLYLGKTIPELLELQRKISEDPRSKNPDSKSIWIYSKAARRRLDNISWAITCLLKEKRERP
jgi:hypothetical protein